MKRFLIIAFGCAIAGSIDAQVKAVPDKVIDTVKQLGGVVITANVKNPYKVISETDIKFRSVSNSQEVLRMVPGLFISQHQGGGKAEQIFLRGFDNDHGTDISLAVDGMPINMVSHAHGQGYADSHFIIPEIISDIVYEKGMYDASKGDLSVSGAVDYGTANMLNKNLIKIETGQFDTYRLLGMLNLLGQKAAENNQSWYAASEYRYSNSYFDNPQHFQRYNFFTKYHGEISSHHQLTISASAFYSKWNASGQVPEYAINTGQVRYFGAIDPNEGGITSRINLNAQLRSTVFQHDIFINQFYYSRYKFDLHTNFSFFLIDSVNGDEIRQGEGRNLFGYTSSYAHDGYLGNKKMASTAGIGIRVDVTSNTSLSHTINRYTIINRIKFGDITEGACNAYLNEIIYFSTKMKIVAGLRFDQLYYAYRNKLQNDSAFRGLGTYTAENNVVSPKLSFYYQLNDRLQFYLISGKGFNSNDARVVVAAARKQSLAGAYGIDLGSTCKLFRNLLINAALWYSYLEKEFVYGGDGGTIEFSGETRRLGFDISARYRPIKPLYVDMDINYANGRSPGNSKGKNYIPLAPVWSSAGGISCNLNNKINGSLRYRYLSDRPANEDYSLTAAGYFVTDLVINYTKPKYELGLTVNNLFNVKWKESQFETITRLKNKDAVDGITFTPGTPFSALFHVSLFF